MSKRQDPFHPVSLIPTLLEISLGSLDAAMEQLGNMEKIKERPWVLDDDIIDRFLKIYPEQNETSEFFLKQCSYWKENGNLNEIQLKQVLEIEYSTNRLDEINAQLVTIFEYCKAYTINQMIEKDDVKLALNALAGKIPSPKSR